MINIIKTYLWVTVDKASPLLQVLSASSHIAKRSHWLE